jgi:UDP-N-acetylmuramoylalanine-D-glutamate ligase
MASSLFGNAANAMRSQLNGQQNPLQMISQFAEFKKSMQGKDPQAMINQLISSGKMSQEQFNNLAEQAKAFKSLLK